MKLHINESWWSAWQNFGWEKGTWGVGINKDIVNTVLKNGDIIEMTVGKSPVVYKIKAEDIISFSDSNKSVTTVKGTSLYVVSKSFLEERK